MGWSCARRAAYRLDAITNACVKETGSQNVYLDGGRRFMWETSRREHVDGAITGTIYALDDNGYIQKRSSFRIDGDGKMRGPRRLRNVPCEVVVIDGYHELFWRRDKDGEPSNDTLRAYIKGSYIEQYLPGGINAHVSRSLGHVPYPSEARVIDVHTGELVAAWKTAMFEGW